MTHAKAQLYKRASIAHFYSQAYAQQKATLAIESEGGNVLEHHVDFEEQEKFTHSEKSS